MHLAALSRLYGVLLWHGELSPKTSSFSVWVAIVTWIKGRCCCPDIVTEPANGVFQDPPSGSVNENDPHTGIHKSKPFSQGIRSLLLPPSGSRHSEMVAWWLGDNSMNIVRISEKPNILSVLQIDINYLVFVLILATPYSGVVA